MFKQFFLDTNQFWGLQSSHEQWGETLKKFCKYYPENDVYSICKENRDEKDNFGLYPEHSGLRTLGQFFDENGMEKI